MGIQITPKKVWLDEAKRLGLILAASIIMAINIKTFVRTGGLFPGGFNGLTLLIQRSAEQFWGIALPFSVINFLLNAVPALISFKTLGKKFTVYSCIMILLTSVLTDVIPDVVITYDVLLICIFGGIINGFAISLCLMGRAIKGAPILSPWRCLKSSISTRGIIFYSQTRPCSLSRAFYSVGIKRFIPLFFSLPQPRS